MLFLAAILVTEIPEPLDAALSHPVPAEEFVAGRLRITEGEATIEFSVAYDEAGEASVTLLAPGEDSLSEAETALWENYRDDEDDGQDEEPGRPRTFGLYDGEALRNSIGADARFDREEAGMLLFSFSPQGLITPDGGDEADQIIEHLAGTVAVDPASNHVAWIEYSAPERFKPNMAARIERFTMRTAYTDSGSGPRFSRMDMEIAGSAMFNQFAQTTVVELIEAEFAAAD